MDQDYSNFIKDVQSITSIDLSLYKEAQMKRRLTAFRDKKSFESFSVFSKALMKDRRLLDELLDRMTINVSEFYRNPERWMVLKDKIIPDLLSRTNKLKIWSAACSTGEEPYTLASLLQETGRNIITYSILATDLDELALRRAKEGLYAETSIKNVPESVRNSSFRQKAGGFAVTEALKKPIVFKQHNLLADVFEKSFDLIVCRNVMIYFTEDAKEALFHKFSESLRPGGYLFVGSTEQIFHPGRFNLQPREAFLYQKPLV
ncbi:protein-glutamate O-methyltransferase CheR [Fictibacillus sp. KU28468]|uniref:CheR family methyltransferase n=1 Tax=Fictibacillus sp. KU28468 TaxID=2991053 RepID=UPI002AC847E7|nr:protein-glutamate O-methyltransferase CheR [Fictibacillus sp. KU28468]